MSKMKILHTDFSAGEIGPRMGGRIDTGIFRKGAKELTNMIVQEDGGLTKRTGSKKIINSIDYDSETETWNGKRSRLISTVISGNQPYLVEFSHLKARIGNADETFSDPTDLPQPDINVTRAYTSVIENYTGYIPSGQTIRAKFDAAHIWFTPAEISRNSLTNVRDLVMFKVDGASINLTDLYEIEFSIDGITGWESNNTFLVDSVNRTPSLKNIRYFSKEEIDTIYSRNGFTNFSYSERIYDKTTQDCTSTPQPDMFGEPQPDLVTCVDVDWYLPSDCKTSNLATQSGKMTEGYYILTKIPSEITIASQTQVHFRLRNVTKKNSFKQFLWTKNTSTYNRPHPTLRIAGSTPSDRLYSSWGEWGFIADKATDPLTQRWPGSPPFLPPSPMPSTYCNYLDAMTIGQTFADVLSDVTIPAIVGVFATPYTEEEIFQIKYIQIDNKLILVHPNHPIKKLEVDLATTFTTLALSNTPAGLNDSGGSELGNYPSCCSYFQGRLYFAGTNNAPNTVWASKAGIPFDFGTITDSPASGFFFTLNSQRSNRILWMEGRTELILGTASAEWRVIGTQGLLTATTIYATRQTTFGSNGIQGKLINDALYFIQRDGRRVREYQFSNELQAYNSPDITMFAHHITKSTIVDNAYAQDPDNIIYSVLANGKLVLCTYSKAKQVMAWTRFETDGMYEAISIVPGVANEDDVWAIVNRDGKRYIERFAFRGDNSASDAVYMDSYLTFYNPVTTTISGLGHLEGKQVYYVIDGEYYPPTTVTNGEIEIEQTGDVVHIGLPFAAKIVTPKIDEQVGIGVLKRVSKVKARLFQTVGLKAGNPPEEQMFRTANDEAFNRFFPLDDDLEIYYPGGFDKTGYVELTHDYPTPFTLLALQIEYEANEI